MADEHRRVEAQESIVGSGMMTDPERIASLDAERQRRDRAWRKRPEKGFSAVLNETPASQQERTGVYVPRDERLQPEERAEKEDTASDSDSEPDADTRGPGDVAADEAPTGEMDRAATPLPRVAPDPRIARLHQAFDGGAGKPSSSSRDASSGKRARRSGKKRARRTKERSS